MTHIMYTFDEEGNIFYLAGQLESAKEYPIQIDFYEKAGHMSRSITLKSDDELWAFKQGMITGCAILNRKRK